MVFIPHFVIPLSTIYHYYDLFESDFWEKNGQYGQYGVNGLGDNKI